MFHMIYVFNEKVLAFQDMETTQIFNYGWINQYVIIYLHNGILCNSKKGQNHIIDPYMDRARI